MSEIHLVRTFDNQGYCSVVEPIPETKTRVVIILSGPNAGSPRVEIDDPLYGVISSARGKFRELEIVDGLSGKNPPELIQSLKDVLGEYWFKVLIKRKSYGPKQLSFSAQLDMSFSPNVEALIPMVGKSVKDIFLENRGYHPVDISTKVFIGKDSPKIRVISVFDPAKTPRRGRKIDGVFIPEEARY